MILRNLQWQTLAQAGGRGLMLLAHLLLPLWMGWEAYGTFMLVWVWLAVLVHPLVDGGVNPLITGDVARGHVATASHAQAFRATVAVAVLPLVAAVTAWQGLAPATVAGLWAWFVLLSLAMTAMAVFRGLERMELEALLSLTMRAAILLALGALFLLGALTPASAAAVLAGAAALMLVPASVLAWRLLRRAVPTAAVAWPGRTALLAFARRGLPLTLVMMSSVLYLRVDSIMLGALVGEAAVAHYQVPFRLVEAAFMLPIIAVVALYPQIARAERARRRRLLGRGLAGVAALGLALALVFAVAGPPLFARFYGDAAARAIETLVVLSWAIPFAFLAQFLARVLPLYGLQMRLAVLGGLGLAVNIAVNAVLIPAYAEIGAALTTILTQAGVAAGAFALLRRGERHGPAAPG